MDELNLKKSIFSEEPLPLKYKIIVWLSLFPFILLTPKFRAIIGIIIIVILVLLKCKFLKL